jgi:nicotinamidase-related amidase
MWGPTFPELVEALPGVEIIDCSSVNAFDDGRVACAIAATGRKKLIFAGITLEVCAAFPAIPAVGKGLDAYVAVDASGTFSETKRQVGLRTVAPFLVEKYTLADCSVRSPDVVCRSICSGPLHRREEPQCVCK